MAIHNMLNRGRSFVALAAVAALLGGGEAWADNFTARQAGNWSNANTWENTTTGQDPATSPPGASDNAVTDSNSGHDITVQNGTNAEVNNFDPRTNVTIATGGSLAVGNSYTSRHGVTTVQADAAFTVGDDYRISSNSSIVIAGTVEAGDPKGLGNRVDGYEMDLIGNGTFNATNGKIPVQDGEIILRGSNATMNLQTFEWGANANSDGGSLTYEADASGLSLVNVAPNQSGHGGALQFSSEALRSLTADVSALSPTAGEMWTLMTFDSISRDVNGDDWQTKTITGAGNPSNWSFDVNDSEGTLTLTYVPEPASLALMGLGGGLLLFRRRRA